MIKIQTKAMASKINILVADASDAPIEDWHGAEVVSVFRHYEALLSRFKESSELWEINQDPSRMHRVSRLTYAAIREAYEAYLKTKSIFDPRVYQDLCRLGYSVSFAKINGDADSDTPEKRDPLPAWNPEFDAGSTSVKVGSMPIDLGGIGKGLAVRDAAAALGSYSSAFLIEAGGDCYAKGSPADVDEWLIGIENPSGNGHLAIVAVRDAGCATSSIRLRNWRRGGSQVHHLIDPSTGLPGGEGLLSVTVLHPDPVRAEILSKTLFLSGQDRINEMAEEENVAAFWVFDDGSYRFSSEMQDQLRWLAT